MEVVDWLREGDPAIRWQVLGDVVHAPAEQVAAERARVEHEGWGARLLALRDPDGQWAGGACFPCQVVEDWKAGIEPDFSVSQPWTSTLPILVLLRDLGLKPASQAARETIALAAGLLEEQLDDGGWNCWSEQGATGSSVHTTICVLEGLLEYERTGGAVAVGEARRRGEEYLLERRLLRRRSTGEVADERWLQLSWPPRWHYDVLRALDYFRRAHDVPDDRLAEAVQLVRDKRQPDGRWLLENTHPGETHFELEDGDGRPSRWNTLRALRVLDWHDRRS